MAADLVGRQVAAIVTAGIDPTKVAKAATASLPIVFLSDVDPVNAGVVTSLNRPGGNVTDVSLLGSALEAKRLALLSEIVSGTAPIGVLLDPGFPDVNLELRDLQDAANTIKRQIIVERASNGPEIDTASQPSLDKERARSLLRKTRPSVTSSTSSQRWRPTINCPRCTHSVNLPKRAVSSVTGPTLRTGIAKQESTLEKFSRVRSLPTCR